MNQFEALERRKNKRRVATTEQEIMTAMIEFMESQPEFKKEGDTFVEKVLPSSVRDFYSAGSTDCCVAKECRHQTYTRHGSQGSSCSLYVRERLKGQRDIQSVKRAIETLFAKRCRLSFTPRRRY